MNDGAGHRCSARYFTKERGGNMNEELKSTRHRPGWLIPYLLALDDMFYHRWSYWLNAVESDRIPESAIPRIDFKPSFTYNSREVRKNIDKCLDYAQHYSSRSLEDFVDWILWGFNYGKEISFPNVDDKIDNWPVII